MGNTFVQFFSRRTLLVSALAGVMLFVLAGCAPLPAAGEVTIPQDGALAVTLPAIVLDVDGEGGLSLDGVPLTALGAALGQDLSAATLPASLVTLLTDANIQHLQVTNTGAGLNILANGLAIPSVSWDSASLSSTADLLAGLDVVDAATAQLLPLLDQAAVGVVLNLPVQAGAEAIPLTVAAPSEEVVAAEENQNRFLSSVRNRIPELNLTINYNSAGEASIDGVSPMLLSALGVSLNALTQDPAVIQQLKDAGVSAVALASNADGAFVSINGEMLPYIDWSDGKMITLIDLLADAGALDAISDRPSAREALLGVVKQLVPLIQAANLNLTVNFE